VTALWNPPAIVRWNSNKRYLQEIARRGAPVVPTQWLSAGCQADIAALLASRGWTRAVLKPVVGLATRDVLLVEPGADGLARAQAHADRLLAHQDVMVQPFVASVETSGERALVFIDGKYSHAVSKIAFQPLAAAGEAGEKAVVADADEIAVAKMVAATVEGALYARVDLVRDDAGHPMVIEFELVEPSLFLCLNPPAAERFSDAVARLLT